MTADLERDLSFAREEIEHLKAHTNALRAQIANERQRAEADLAAARAELDAERMKPLLDFEKQADAWQERAMKSEADLAAARAEIERLKDERDEARDNRDDARLKIVRVVAELDALRAQSEALRLEQREVLIAYLRDRQAQYVPSSGIFAALDDLIVGLLDDEDRKAAACGELDDLIPWVRALAKEGK